MVRTEVERLARFAVSSCYERLSTRAAEQLKIRVLDSLGVAIAAQSEPPAKAIRELVGELDGSRGCRLIGGGAAAPDRAALYNGALVRCLDYMDSYVAPGETFHPSDNLAAVLAAGEWAGATGKDFLAALAVAYEVQARLAEKAPVRSRGFDHCTLGAFAAAAGVSRALGLGSSATANAIAIAGTANVALRVTRTGALSHWKGLAAPYSATSALLAALLAARGITGPSEVFEGVKGFKQSVSGPFEVDWENEGLNAVHRSILKKYDAEIHAQTTVEAALELRSKHRLTRERLFGAQALRIHTFQVAYDIIGGGAEGGKHRVRTREEADHSLPYMVAAALLDGQLGPEQYRAARILASDVQLLLSRVAVEADSAYTARFPGEMPSSVLIELSDGSVLFSEKSAYEGFHSQPMSWEAAAAKFDRLCEPFAATQARRRILDAVSKLEDGSVSDFAKLLDLGRSEKWKTRKA